MSTKCWELEQWIHVPQPDHHPISSQAKCDTRSRYVA